FVEFAELLQVPVLLLGEQLYAHRGGHVDRAAGRLVLFPRLQRLAVITEAAAARRAFRGAVAEDVLARSRVLPDDVRLAPGSLHFVQRPELLRPGFEPGPRSEEHTSELQS